MAAVTAADDATTGDHVETAPEAATEEVAAADPPLTAPCRARDPGLDPPLADAEDGTTALAPDPGRIEKETADDGDKGIPKL